MMDRQQTLLLFAYALIVLINADDRTDDSKSTVELYNKGSTFLDLHFVYTDTGTSGGR